MGLKDSVNSSESKFTITGASLQEVFHSKENTVVAHSINSLGDGVECPLKFADHHRREKQLIGIPAGEVAWQKPKFNEVQHLGQKAKEQLGAKGPGCLLYKQVQ